MCRLCDAFWKWVWRKSDAWEGAHSNESELCSRDTDQNRDLIERALAIEETSPNAAFRLYSEAAEAGSGWSMAKVGWAYWTGTGVTADSDKALEYYHRAICAGSWLATISYARLLAEQGHHDHAERVLKDGIASDFVPAYFWLAKLRYDRSKAFGTCREIRPMLEYAAWRGHPEAQLMLARLMTFGRFGPRKILTGLKAGLRFCRSAANSPDGPASVTR